MGLHNRENCATRVFTPLLSRLEPASANRKMDRIRRKTERSL